MNPWRVVAFHTDDDLYNEMIGNLRSSLLKFSIPFSIEVVPNQGSWKANTMAMSGYIYDAFDKHEEDLVFLDADAVVRQYPVLFDTIEEDFACHYKDGYNLLAGTMYFKNCAKVKDFVKTWQECSLKRTDKLSAQTGISDALKKSEVSIYELPAPYTLIFDKMKHQGPPVIEHFQASRRYKKCGRL
jgi:hypothetical protein